ncbi:hypothetical protein BDZ94DRAFT_1250928 [Collybia nuda]|uniref:Uncharacterized protein n=1 Tax=Collybia nuda TaxID=64659 RepID=A0A9P5YD18_9AGAR|nr:hypothetical protein BDZ94DRAFT_1250928 [Collybia nuda]
MGTTPVIISIAFNLIKGKEWVVWVMSLGCGSNTTVGFLEVLVVERKVLKALRNC